MTKIYFSFWTWTSVLYFNNSLYLLQIASRVIFCIHLYTHSSDYPAESAYMHAVRVNTN